jgi:hypothetical protein
MENNNDSINFEAWKKVNKGKPIKINYKPVGDSIRESKKLFCDRINKIKESINPKNDNDV